MVIFNGYVKLPEGKPSQCFMGSTGSTATGCPGKQAAGRRVPLIPRAVIDTRLPGAAGW
jgi:hypothetical protein